ncbi:MAG: hypothetical protein ACAI35_12320 [Candidatus Methylacidiphilales bacterium]|nr:hypothetical protein [Candidatus Methylacidiphilales bacterium]
MRHTTRTTLAAFILGASLLLTACSDPRSLTDTKIRAVKSEMSSAEVIAILGEPQEIETTSSLQINAEYHSYTGPAGTPTAGILYVQDKVWRIDSPLPSQPLP